jgi:uncharacterized OsmC-like protein
MTDTTVREALEKISSVISTQPEKARAKNAPATARLIERLRCELSGPNGESLTTDMPPAMGGNASGPNPGWLLRSALASCHATVIAMRAATLGVSLKRLEVTVESESDNRGLLGLDERVSAGLHTLRTRVRIGAEGASSQQLEEIVRWADTHSPVGCTVRQPLSQSLEIEVL